MECNCHPVLDADRNDEFWNRLRALIDEFPEFYTRMDDAIEGANDPNLGEEYDPKSPKLINGLVLILNPCNLQGYETSGILTPRRQSRYLTEGLITNASYNS